MSFDESIKLVTLSVWKTKKCNIENGIVNLKNIMFYNKLIMMKLCLWQPRRLITTLYQYVAQDKLPEAYSLHSN